MRIIRSSIPIVEMCKDKYENKSTETVFLKIENYYYN